LVRSAWCSARALSRNRFMKMPNTVFADFTYETSLFDDKRTYRLIDYTAADSYQLLLGKEKEEVDFLRAIQVLLK